MDTIIIMYTGLLQSLGKWDIRPTLNPQSVKSP